MRMPPQEFGRKKEEINKNGVIFHPPPLDLISEYGAIKVAK